MAFIAPSMVLHLWRSTEQLWGCASSPSFEMLGRGEDKVFLHIDQATGVGRSGS
jgi:hypothetical protein